MKSYPGIILFVVSVVARCIHHECWHSVMFQEGNAVIIGTGWGSARLLQLKPFLRFYIYFFLIWNHSFLVIPIRNDDDVFWPFKAWTRSLVLFGGDFPRWFRAIRVWNSAGCFKPLYSPAWISASPLWGGGYWVIVLVGCHVLVTM